MNTELRNALLQTAKPILFNTEMVGATLHGCKTATRRVVKFPVNKFTGEAPMHGDVSFYNTYCNENTVKIDIKPHYCMTIKVPYCIGDILYVRETWRQWVGGYSYKADAPEWACMWHPSIHMPKDAARIFLRVTDVRVERLQDIVTDDYKTPLNINAEGLYKPCCNCTHVNGDCKDFISRNDCRLLNEFKKLWDSTIKKSDLDAYGWNANPWVWVIEFERMEVE